MLFANAQCAIITPNMQNVRKAFIERKSLDNSEFWVSIVSLYQFLGSEKQSNKVVTARECYINYYWFRDKKKQQKTQWVSDEKGREINVE